VAADGVHLADGGAAGLQCTVDDLFVFQRQPGQRRQRRATASNQAQHDVLRTQTLHHLQQALGGA
jgi:hypothetical protein